VSEAVPRAHREVSGAGHGQRRGADSVLNVRLSVPDEPALEYVGLSVGGDEVTGTS
jgi:hypothetical protein